MANFANPFVGIVPDRKLSLEELIRAIRLDLAAEEEATFIYNAHADATDNEKAREVLKEIADEERIHIGEFQKLLDILTIDGEDLINKGKGEVDSIYQEEGVTEMFTQTSLKHRIEDTVELILEDKPGATLQEVRNCVMETLPRGCKNNTVNVIRLISRYYKDFK